MIDKRMRFNYPDFGHPDGFPEYTAHRGAVVTVLRLLTDQECDPECGPMYAIRADDGWEGVADGSELVSIQGESES